MWFYKCEYFNKKKPERLGSGFTIQNKCAINHMLLKMIQLSCLGEIVYIFRDIVDLGSIHHIKTFTIKTTSTASKNRRLIFFI